MRTSRRAPNSRTSHGSQPPISPSTTHQFHLNCAVRSHLSFDSEMKKKATIGIVIGVALLLCIMPCIDYQGAFYVQVTWRIQEAKPTEHTVTFSGDSFEVPAGGSVTQIHKLIGGGQKTPLYDIRGWRLRSFGQPLLVDGRDLYPNEVRISRTKGKLHILGLGSAPAMEACIVLNDSQENLRR